MFNNFVSRLCKQLKKSVRILMARKNSRLCVYVFKNALHKSCFTTGRGSLIDMDVQHRNKMNTAMILYMLNGSNMCMVAVRTLKKDQGLKSV